MAQKQTLINKIIITYNNNNTLNTIDYIYI